MSMHEFDLLKHVYAASADLDARVRIGPGDDMAEIELGGRRLLAAVDQLVAGRHVSLPDTALELVGRKAITRCLSDVAAMAGRPVGALVAATLPPDFGTACANALFDAMRATAESFDCPLIGGDIAFHATTDQPLTCAVTVLAEPVAPGPVTRSGARAGDGVYVTGILGGSFEPDGGGHHLTFTPRIETALGLLATLGERLHAMIDVSDGIGRDLSHVATLSGVSITLDAGDLPCRAGLDWRRAASDGEDYELCFTAAGEVPERLGDVPVTRIGVVASADPTDGPGVFIRDGATLHDATVMGWQHES